MSNESESQDRRNFFRLEDQVYLQYRPASEEEVKKARAIEPSVAPKAFDARFQLDTLSQQLSPLLMNIRAESPAIAQYLEGLNRKLDVIAGMVLMQQAGKEDSEQHYSSATTVDISEGGVSFDADTSPELNSFLFCRMSIAGFQLGLETYGKVVYTSQSKENAGKVRVGVEFPYITEYERKQLTRYIFDKQREMIRQAAEDKD